MEATSGPCLPTTGWGLLSSCVSYRQPLLSQVACPSLLSSSNFIFNSSHITIYVNVNLDNATGVAPVLEHTPIPDSILFLASEFFLKDTISLTVFFCFFFPFKPMPLYRFKSSVNKVIVM